VCVVYRLVFKFCICLLSTVILPVLQEVLDSADAWCEIMYVVIYTLAF